MANRPIPAVEPLGSIGLAWVAGYAVLIGLLLAAEPRLALLPVGIFLVVVPLIRKPVVAPVLVLALVPLLSGMPRGLLVPVFRPNELVLILAFVCYSLVFAIGKKQAVPLTFLDGAFLIFLVARGVIPLFLHPAEAVADPTRIAKFFLAPFQYYLLYRLVLGTVTTEKGIRAVWWTIIAGGLVVAVVGLLQAARFPPIEVFLRRYYPSSKSMYTFLHSPRVTSLFAGGWNVCGFFLSQVLLLGIVAHPVTAGRGKAVLGAALVLVALVMGLTFSFTSTLAFAVALWYVARRQGKASAYFARALPVAAAVILVIALFFAGPLLERLRLQFYGTVVPMTVLARLSVWTTRAMPVIGQYLLTGIGPYRFDWIDLDNYYLYLAVCNGVLSPLLFIAFAVVVWRGLGRAERGLVEGSDAWRTVLLGKAFFIQVMIANITGLYFEYSGASEILWTFWALSAGIAWGTLRLGSSRGGSAVPEH